MQTSFATLTTCTSTQTPFTSVRPSVRPSLPRPLLSRPSDDVVGVIVVMGVAEGYYFTRAVGVPLGSRGSVPRSMQSRSIWRFTLTAPTPQRSRRPRSGLPPARLCKRDGSSSTPRRAITQSVLHSWASRKVFTATN